MPRLIWPTRVSGTPSTAEKFDFDAPAPLVSLKSVAGGKFVTAESAGAKPLIARGTSIGAWEGMSFLDYNADGSVYLYANVNEKAVTAGSAGTSQLIAGRTIDWDSPTLGLGAGEKFVIAVI